MGSLAVINLAANAEKVLRPCDAGAGLLLSSTPPCLWSAHRKKADLLISANRRQDPEGQGDFVPPCVSFLDVYHLPCPSLMLLLNRQVKQNPIKYICSWTFRSYFYLTWKKLGSKAELGCSSGKYSELSLVIMKTG